jgi:endonuclease III
MAPARRGPLSLVLDRLESLYGRPARPPTDPLHLLLLENVAYLVSDERRDAAFKALRTRVGLSAERILAARPAVLREIAVLGGMLPDHRMAKLLRVAETARELGDLRTVVRGPRREAVKALRRFPGIGEPGAEKILLFAGAANVLALESNGLRVLQRLGYGEEKKTYGATYKSVQAAVTSQIPKDNQGLVRAHLLLRRHGQELCRRTAPHCPACPVRAVCQFGGGKGKGGRA